MNPYYEHAGITIYCGDCREILRCSNTPELNNWNYSRTRYARSDPKRD